MRMDKEEMQQGKAEFKLWLAENCEDNHADIERLKKMFPVAIKECCTEKQRIYIAHFFVDRMKMKDIAALYGVNISTVSRSIRNGLHRIYSHLKFCSPTVCADRPRQGYLTQKKIGRKRAQTAVKGV